MINNQFYGMPYSNTPPKPQQDLITNLFGNIQNFQMQKQMIEQQIQQSGQSPEQLVRGLISNGQMTQEQFMQYSQIANALSSMMQ